MHDGSTPATQLAAESRLATEWREAPEVLRRQQDALAGPLATLMAALRYTAPRLIVTCARGSSAHAATYGKHLFERYLGLPVATAAPNIASVYHGTLRLEGQFMLAISQSGRSEDLLAVADMARRAGAITAALVNDEASPLAQVCEHVLPLAAGPELSVAATKSFIASLAALLRITAAWAEDATIARAAARLPERIAQAGALDWSAASPRLLTSLAAARSVMVIGRGPTLAIAREAALKLKEVCNIHAEAFSSAEFRHGPIALVEPAYPILLFGTADETADSLRTVAQDLRQKGATVFATGMTDADLPALAPDQADTDAIGAIQAFYRLLLRLAARRGSDVDRPRHLHKVTTTR